MINKCPNQSSPEWKRLVSQSGENKELPWASL